MSVKKRGLGKGLSSLLSVTPASLLEDDVKIVEVKSNSLRFIPVEKIQRGKYQPRREISPEALEDLAKSIKSQGLLQPIVLRTIDEDKFEIIAGERRWRACQMAGLDKIPALIKEVSDEVTMALALIENIQRENLNPVEEALAIQRLIDECELTHQEVAESLGKPRASISNLLRILNLNAEVRSLLEHGDIELGHAKVLLAMSGPMQTQIARVIAAKNLSVRQTEELVRKAQLPVAEGQTQEIDPDVKSLQNRLMDKFGSKVDIIYNQKGKGKLVIHYNDLDELDGILAHIQ